jgi:outer membrane lipoprotein-sorting protein
MNRIRKTWMAYALILVTTSSAHAANRKPNQSRPAQASAQTNGVSLGSILASMDKASQQFKNAQADFKWDQFESAVSEHDIQSGTIYFQREKGQLKMMAHVTQPANAEKYALYDGSTVKLFDVTPNRVTVYGTGKNKETFETFLVLGFGGSGQDLKKSFDVSMEAMEPVNGVGAARLLLIPKSEKVRNVFDKIYLWINPANGICVRQKLMEPQTGNYRDAFYSNIQVNRSLPKDAFKLPTNNKTQTVRPPQG